MLTPTKASILYKDLTTVLTYWDALDHIDASIRTTTHPGIRSTTVHSRALADLETLGYDTQIHRLTRGVIIPWEGWTAHQLWTMWEHDQGPKPIIPDNEQDDQIMDTTMWRIRFILANYDTAVTHPNIDQYRDTITRDVGMIHQLRKTGRIPPVGES